MNTTKKIIGALFAAVVLITPAVTFAASLNNDPLDFATLRVANNTTNPAGSTTAWARSANAKAGDTVSFAIYYHNTGPDTANNVRVRLTPQTTGTGTTQTFTATVSADNAPGVTGTATVVLSSSQSISFDGTTYWYPYNSNPTTEAPLLNGQTGAELFNGAGLNLGNIEPGWTTQGSVTANFRVSATPASTAPFVTTNSATGVTQSTATLNGSVTPNGAEATSWFEWGTTSSFGNTTPTQFEGAGTSAVALSAPLWNITPNTTYYFRAVANNARGTARGSILSFTTSGTTPTSNLPTVTTNNATSISQNSTAINGYVNPNGSTDTVRWFEWGTSAGNLNNQTTRYNHGTTPDGFSTNLTGLAQNTTYYFRAVAQNSQGAVQGSTLSFTTSNGSPSSSVPTVTTNNATNVSQNGATLNGYVNPNNTSDTIRWFEWGNSSWNLNNQTTRYNHGSNSDTFSTSIYGLAPNTTYYFRAVAQNSQGLVQGTILSFGSNGGNGQQLPVVATQTPTNISRDFAVLNGYVDPSNTSDTVRWFEWGTSEGNLYNQTTQYNQGSAAGSFTASLTGLSQNTAYYFRAVARNSMGTVYGSKLPFTTTGQINDNLGVAPTVTTLLATQITSSSAVLNGLVFTSSSQSSNTWFEWGTNTNTTNKTQTFVAGVLPVVRAADTISGLVDGQTYYYRVVAENSYGRAYGSTLNFVAQNNDTTVVISTPPVRIIRTVTVVNGGIGTESLIMLTIDGGDETILKGEKRVYRVTWKNISAQTLRNVVLRVTFPVAMNVDSATRGSFSRADNAVIVDVKTLIAGEQGDTFIFATAGDNLNLGQLLVVAANMVYTKLSNVQGDAIAYVTHRVGADIAVNNFGASIFGAGIFLPSTLLGWLLLIILVLGLVLLGNHVYGRFSKDS